MGQSIEHIEQQLENKFTLSSQQKGVTEFIHNDSNIPFVLIRGGDYMMGLSVEEEKAAFSITDSIPFDPENMRPHHPVHVGDFLVSKTPVQNHQIPTVFSWEYEEEDKSTPANVDHNTLEKIVSHFNMAIPSEEQWEFMCRAHSTSLFVFGNALPDDNELEKWIDCDFSDLTKLNCNDFGVYGLFAGEWCSDFYRETYNVTVAEKYRVLRGGGSLFWPWQDEEWIWCMSAMRTHSEENTEAAFRLVYSL